MMQKGKITIGRRHSNTEPDYIHFDLVDEVSGTHFCQVKMAMIDFAHAITGLGQVDCQFDLYPANVGKRRQVKTAVVPLADPFRASASERLDALKPFEIDGWQARDGDISNHHNYTEKGVRVVFIRFVDVE